MHARLFEVAIAQRHLADFDDAFDRLVTSDVTGEPGFRGLYLLRDDTTNIAVAIVLWHDEDAAAADDEGMRARRIGPLMPYLAEQPLTRRLRVTARA